MSKTQGPKRPSKAQLFDLEHTLKEGPVPLEKVLRGLFPEASWSVIRGAIQTGKVSVNDDPVRETRFLVRSKAQIRVRMTTPKKRAYPKVVVVHVDPQLVVVAKPAGLASVPDDQRRNGTLIQRVAAQLRGEKGREGVLGVVQRLDLETSGLIVFARTLEARAGLKAQFQKREVSRSYLALVAGRARSTTIRSNLEERSDGKRGSAAHGKFACTHVKFEEALNGASLVRCELETGRTHQIRIHLSEAGHPLLGDRRYARRRIQTPPAPRVMLHAATLGFVHPTSGESLRFEEDWPEDFQRIYQTLRR